MSITRKESIELECTYSSMVRIRTLARQLVEDGMESDAVAKIIELADVFHAVPAEIARGRSLDPKLFRSLAATVGMELPSDYEGEKAVDNQGEASLVVEHDDPPEYRIQRALSLPLVISMRTR